MRSITARRAWLSVLFFVAFAPPLARAADDGWLHEFDEALAAAKEQNKDILIDFSGTDWCQPCQKLWNKTLSKPEFVKLASDRFVLLDIDNLVRDPMPEGRKQRYEALEKRFGIQAHPTVVLATAEGLPYASTGLVEESENPADYWEHLKPLHERGQKFQAALAAEPADASTAQKIVAALSELRPDFVVRFYAGTLDELRTLDPADQTGYLAFIDARRELTDLEWKLHERWLDGMDKWEAGEAKTAPWVAGFAPADVDKLIEKHRLQGAARQEALFARGYLEIDAAQWAQVLTTLAEIAAIDGTPSKFDQANFMQLKIPARDKLRDDVREAQQLAGDPLAQLKALYNILHGGNLYCETPTLSCDHCFNGEMHLLALGAAYADLLSSSTVQLQGEERAKAIAHGLEGIELYRNGSIGRLISELSPGLVHRATARKLLPADYREWLPDYGEELAKYNDELRRDPNGVWALNGLAWIMATADDPQYRNGARAVELATHLNEVTEWKNDAYLDTLAAACAEQGDFEAALKWQTKALELVDKDSTVLKAQLNAHRKLYEAGKPCRE